jgi:drug/metabolite transporter (DMT)-like permease
MIMLGEAFSLLAAFLWAGSTIVAAKALKDVAPVSANALRTLFATASMLPIAFAISGSRYLFNLDPYGSLLVVVAAIIGFGIGDTCLYKGIGLIGLSRSYTIGYSYPFFVMAFAALLLGEPFQAEHIVGTAIIFLAIANIFLEKNISIGETNRKGIIVAFAAAISWSLGTTLVALGLKTIDIIQANTIRFPFLFVILFLISRMRSRGGKWTMRAIFFLLISGLLGMTLGGVVFLFSIKLIGVSRAAPLSSSSPIWASLMSSLFLKEKISWRVIASSIMVAAGTFFLL